MQSSTRAARSTPSDTLITIYVSQMQGEIRRLGSNESVLYCSFRPKAENTGVPTSLGLIAGHRTSLSSLLLDTEWAK